MLARSDGVKKLVILLSLSLSACSSSDVSETNAPDPPDPPGDAPTWHQDVAPLITARCAGCHQPGAIAPFDWTSYQEAAGFAELIAVNVEAGTMPPWAAVPEGDCAPNHAWKDDPTLADDEVALLRAWADAGAPEGDPAGAADLPPLPDRNLTGVTHELTANPWTTMGTEDEFRCFVLDPGFTQDMWLSGLQVYPGDVSVVHHAVVSVDEDGSNAALVGPDGSYECFGGMGGAVLGGYTPGAPPFETPPDTAVRVRAGSLIMLNIHYHPLGFPGVEDQTTVGLRASAAPPQREVEFHFMGNDGTAPTLQPGPNDTAGPQFRIPAGVADHTEQMVYTVDNTGGARVPVWSIYPHMHYVGIDFDVRLERADPAAGQPAEECLMKASRYDFDWQRLYSVDAANDALPTVQGGDTITITCRYDNSMQNPKVVRALDEQGLSQPQDVFLGDETLDEMCVGLFGIIKP